MPFFIKLILGRICVVIINDNFILGLFAPLSATKFLKILSNCFIEFKVHFSVCFVQKHLRIVQGLGIGL